MNKLLKLSGLTFISVLLLCCKSTEEITQYNPPFKVLEATYSERIENDNENRVTINIKIDNPEIKLDSVYFRNMKSLLNRTTNTSEEKYEGHFLISNTTKDIILHSDAEKEFGNRVPDISQKIPFQLEKYQAVVSYVYKNNTMHSKIMKLTKN